MPTLTFPATVPSHRATVAVIHSRQLYLAALVELVSAPPLAATVLAFTRSDEALTAIAGRSVDLVLCGLRSSPVAGPEVTRRIRATGGPRIGLIAEVEDVEGGLAAIRSGADGVLTADMSHGEFASGVDAILRGYYVMSATLVKSTLARQSTPPDVAPAASAYRLLSSTEREILRALGSATTIEAIAAGRGISKKTVRNHVSSIYQKLRLRSRAEAILWVARMGLGEEPLLDDPKSRVATV